MVTLIWSVHYFSLHLVLWRSVYRTDSSPQRETVFYLTPCWFYGHKWTFTQKELFWSQCDKRAGMNPSGTILWLHFEWGWWLCVDIRYECRRQVLVLWFPLDLRIRLLKASWLDQFYRYFVCCLPQELHPISINLIRVWKAWECLWHYWSTAGIFIKLWWVLMDLNYLWKGKQSTGHHNFLGMYAVDYQYAGIRWV